MTGDGLAVGAASFLGKPANEGGSVVNFATGLVERFALFQGHQPSQIFLVLQQQIMPLAQDHAAGIYRQCAPARQGGLRSIDGVLDLAGIELGATPDGFFAGRIDDRFIAPPVTSNPFAIDVGQLANQAWIFKHVHGRCPLYLPGRGEFAAQDVVRVYGSHFRASRSATFSLQGGEWTVFFFFAGGLPRFFSVRLTGPEQAGKTATPGGFGKGYRSTD